MKERLWVKSMLMASIMVISALALPLALTLSSYSGSDLDASVEYISDRDMYYSDEFFYESSTAFNSNLATLSMFMANNSIVLGEPGNKQNSHWYESQPDRIKKFFTSIHFDDFACNDDYKKQTAFDTIGVAVAKKKITVDGKDYTLIGMAIRSGGYYNEWANNIWLGDGSKSDYMHEGWYNAANKAIAFLKEYISGKGISGDIKFWVSGFSRGGATANLIAGLLDNRIDKGDAQLGSNVNLKNRDLYAYTFEAPQGANIYSKTVKSPKDSIYCNIWNIVNPNDLVPKVAMSEWGFTRFGTDLFITTKFFDAEHFSSNRNSLYAFYGKESVDKADKMVLYTLPGVNKVAVYAGMGNILLSLVNPMPGSTLLAICSAGSAVMNAVETDSRKSGYDANIVSTLFLSELAKVVGSRDDYCNNYQDHLKKVMLIFMDDTSARKDVVVEEALITSIVAGVLLLAGGANIGSAVLSVLDLAIGFNCGEDLKDTKDALEALFGPLMTILDNRPTELLSLALNAKQVFENHNSDLVVAHMKAQDRLYLDSWNKSHPSKGISIVPLRDNADMAHVVTNMNQITLYVGPSKNKEVIHVEGHRFGRSDVEKCSAGYAVGYYSYATSEKIEMFFHVDEKYKIEVESFSKKLWKHDLDYDLYYQKSSLTDSKDISKKVCNIHKEVRLSAGPYYDDPNKTVKERAGL